MYGQDGVSAMSPKEWMSMLRDEAPYFFKGSNGGSATGADGKQIHGMTPGELAKLDPMERLRIANGER
jgi:hypothetical protein